ncbi:MAG TPA: MFS transporter [Amnibacterium sp.]|uniref:MFS transporter n=1 Tax=Amnibacterium sp. TaxID=1872496 RepID=UPI002F954400
MTRLVPAVLRDEPQYRLLFAGQLLSIFGDRVSMLVLPFAVLAVGGTVTGVVAVSVAQFLPFVVLALPAGVWADRFDRKRIVIASDAVRMVTQATAAATLFTGTATVPLLAALAALYGAADAFFSPAITALVPAIVSPRNLQPANALRGLTFSLGSVLGPAIGGVLVALLGPGGGFAFDAATFVVSVACLLRLRPAVLDAALETATPMTERFLPSLARGWREVVSRRWVLAFLAGWTGYSVLVLPSIFALGPALAARDYGGAPGWAIITAGYGIGSVLGDLILLAWRPRFALRIGALALVGASCQAAIIGSGMGVWPIAGLELVAGICVTGCFTLWETSLQEHIPAAQLARVSSYDYLTSTGFIPLGTLLGGALTAALGLQPAMVLMSAVGVCTALGVLAVPAVRALPRGVTDPDPA